MICLNVPLSYVTDGSVKIGHIGFCYDMHMWLIDNCEKRWTLRDWYKPSMAPNGPVLRREGFTIVFERPCDATMFKLVWGGEFTEYVDDRDDCEEQD